MAEYPAKRDPNRCPTHPGELLRDVIPATGKSKTEIAELLGISRQHLYDLLKERKPVSPAVAVRLGKRLATAQASGCGWGAYDKFGMPNAELWCSDMRSWKMGLQAQGRRCTTVPSAVTLLSSATPG